MAMDTHRDLGPQLEELRAKGLFCDVTMIFPRDGGRSMHVHRNILASCSEYFRTLFTFNMTTSCHMEVEIPGISYGDMEACEEFLLSHVSIENVVGMLKIAKYLHCPVLEESALTFILRNFVDIARNSNEFLQLTPDELAQILRTDELIVEREDHACSAVVRWVDFLPDIRTAFLPQLLRSVRLGLLSSTKFSDVIRKYSNLPIDSEASRLLHKGYELCLQFREDSAWSRTLQNCQGLGNPMLRPRVPNEVVFVLGGWSRDGVCADMETFDSRVDKWYENKEASFEHSVAYHAMVSMGKILYVIGGYTTVKYLNSAKKYEPFTKTWIEIAPMHCSRCYVCAAEVNGLIYACGGFDGTNRHRSVERYNPVKNQWQMVSDMNSVRSDAGVCGVDGKLYIAGGFSGTECLNTAECFDPSTNEWTLLSPMNYRRSGVTVVAFRQAVYAIGGFNGSIRLDEVEKYYPERGAWFPVKEMIKGRSNFAAAVMESRIYVVGGYDGTGTTGHVEFYDSERDEWCEASSLRIGRSAASACTLRGLDNVKDYTFYGMEAHLYKLPDKGLDFFSESPRPSRHVRSLLRNRIAKKGNSS